MRRKVTARRVLITGASSGIGRALAIELAGGSNRLVLTARREDRLNELAEEVRRLGSDAQVVAGDITDPSLREQLIACARDAYGGLDLLINNAGIGGIGTFASADEARLRQLMEINFFAPIELIRSALPLLRDCDDAVVVNIGSVLGHCAVPKKSEYCASKFAMHGMSDALRMELAEEGIDLILVSPSTTSSEFFDQAMRSSGKAAKNNNPMTADTVAKHTVRAIERGRREVILSLGGKLLVWADRLAPSLVSLLLRRFG